MDQVAEANAGVRAFQTMVPMRDGTRLNTFVFLPASGGPHFPVKPLQRLRPVHQSAADDLHRHDPFHDFVKPR